MVSVGQKFDGFTTDNNSKVDKKNQDTNSEGKKNSGKENNDDQGDINTTDEAKVNQELAKDSGYPQVAPICNFDFDDKSNNSEDSNSSEVPQKSFGASHSTTKKAMESDDDFDFKLFELMEKFDPVKIFLDEFQKMLDQQAIRREEAERIFVKYIQPKLIADKDNMNKEQMNKSAFTKIIQQEISLNKDSMLNDLAEMRKQPNIS